MIIKHTKCRYTDRNIKYLTIKQFTFPLFGYRISWKFRMSYEKRPMPTTKS